MENTSTQPPLNPPAAGSISRVQISVRALVDTVLRSGNLEPGIAGGHTTVEAIRAHQRLQQARPVDYLPEVTVRERLVVDAHTVELTGRIDGVYTQRDPVVVEEIKTTYTALDDDALQDNRRHWGQLQCYAFLYARRHGLSTIALQLTYCRLPGQRTRTFQRRETIDRLEHFCRESIRRHLADLTVQRQWRQTRDTSIRTMTFPYAHPRQGQHKMADAVYRAIEDATPLLVQAPTGIGKTMAAVYPALKAQGDGHTTKVFYLTARNTGKVAAETALERLRQQGLQLRSLTLTAKDQICVNAGSGCVRDRCPRAQGYFDRLEHAVQDALQTAAWHPETVRALAHRHQLCPFEFSLELALWADWILCDYNYVFDPRTRLRRFINAGSNRYTLLVDEVHNLVERAREMFSAEIQKQPLLHLRRSIKTRWPKLYNRLSAINTCLLDMRRHCETTGNHSSPTPPADLYPLLGTFLHDARLALHAAGPREQDPQLEEIAWQVHGFLQIAERYGDPYATLCEKDGANLRLKLFCRDPAEALHNIYARCRTAIFFSATATPAAYYQQNLGCAPDGEALILPSAFPAEHLRVLVAQGVSTLYRHRGRTRTTVAAMIHAMVASQPGNYLIFLPSYAYLKMIAEAFMANSDGMDVIQQHPQMSSAQRDAFLMRFNQRNPHTLVGFAVAGGLFGEGIDLIGERLTGAAVVGIGLPGMSLERELIRDYYDQSIGSGHAFAYLYPGMTRVLQAAGRVIRSENDRGVVLLIDSRYGHEGIQELLPNEWHLHPVRDRTDIRQQLQDFW